MTKAHAAPGGTPGAARRKHRRRPVPKWLKARELDQIARSRCLMLLSVLSGETPVTDAIRQAKISRGTYYQLETRALEAMLVALNPLASSSDTGAADLSAALARIGELEAQVKVLEQDRRRGQRLLLLQRKSFWTTLKVRRARRPKAASSMPTGKARSSSWKAKAAPSSASTPTKAGASGP
jgi:hypothetical protein